MVSVKLREISTNGWMGLSYMLMGAIGCCIHRDFLARIAFPILILIFIGLTIFRRCKKNEPWDELTEKNYEKARKTTIFFIEITLALFMLTVLMAFNSITLNASHIMLYLGCIKMVETISFVYFDCHIS